jgi:hypothetical protein
MIKIFTALIIVLGVYSVTFAQTKNNVEFGANIGYNISYINETGYGDLQSPAVGGFNFGISADFPVSDKWSIKAKLIYDQKGWDNGYIAENVVTPGGQSIEVYKDLNFNLNYITIPVTADWHFGRHKNWYFNFGPYAGFLLSATANGSSTLNNSEVKDFFNANDFGLALGIGVRFRFPTS